MYLSSLIFMLAGIVIGSIVLAGILLVTSEDFRKVLNNFIKKHFKIDIESETPIGRWARYTNEWIKYCLHKIEKKLNISGLNLNKALESTVKLKSVFIDFVTGAVTSPKTFYKNMATFGFRRFFTVISDSASNPKNVMVYEHNVNKEKYYHAYETSVSVKDPLTNAPIEESVRTVEVEEFPEEIKKKIIEQQANNEEITFKIS
ncbi:MAG: hypothetical protein QM535_19250 [Limnohabitans sp.]|nr:hypothetical protein [Limnohabitans sp.]